MQSDFHFFAHIFASIEHALASFMDGALQDFVERLVTTGRRVLILYVVLWGWALLRGLIQEPLSDGILRVCRVVIVSTLALNVAAYREFVADAIWRTPEALAAIFWHGASGSEQPQFLDAVMSQMYDFGAAFVRKSIVIQNAFGIPNMGLMLVGVSIWIVGVLCTAYGAFLLLLAKMLLSVMLAVGPMFILCLLFHSTKRYFESWFAMVMNSLFVVLLTAGMMRLVFNLLQDYLGTASSVAALADPSITQAFPALVICVISSLVFMQVPSLASSLAGGMTLSTLRGASWLAGTSRNVITGMRPSAIAREINRSKADWRLIKGTGERAMNFGRR